MRSRKLLVATHEYTLSGAPIALFNLIRGLAPHLDITIVGREDGPLRQRFQAMRIDAMVVPEFQGLENHLAGFDAVLANSLVSHRAVHAAQKMHKFCIWYVHEGTVCNQLFADLGPDAPAALALASRVVVPCQFSRRLYAPLRPQIDVIPYGIDAREASGPSPTGGPLKVLQLGSIERRKGQDIACTAVELLAHDAIELGIVGRVLEEKYHRMLMNEFCTPRVRVMAGVDMAKTESLICSCDVLIVPSRDEVTPLVILEAMAAAKPVVAAAVGGIPEMIVHGQTGLLFAKEDARELAGHLQMLGRNPALRQRIGLQAQHFVRGNRSMDSYVGNFAAFL